MSAIKTQYRNHTAAQIVELASHTPQNNYAGGVYVCVFGVDAQIGLTERGNAVCLRTSWGETVFLRCSARTAARLAGLQAGAEAVMAAEIKAENEAALAAGCDA